MYCVVPEHSIRRVWDWRGGLRVVALRIIWSRLLGADGKLQTKIRARARHRRWSERKAGGYLSQAAGRLLGRCRPPTCEMATFGPSEEGSICRGIGALRLSDKSAVTRLFAPRSRPREKGLLLGNGRCALDLARADLRTSLVIQMRCGI
jgi:hypothetical protein